MDQGDIDNWIEYTMTELQVYVDLYDWDDDDINLFIDWTADRFERERNCIKPSEEVEVWLDDRGSKA